MVFTELCLTCDQSVHPERHGNLIDGDGLRARIERVVGGGVGGTPRCVSLCGGCENALDTIEEYYQHVDSFKERFVDTLAKYGETLSTPEQVAINQADADDAAARETAPSNWTICLQAADGSLVPLEQSVTPLVMGDDHQVVLQTVTVESADTHATSPDVTNACMEQASTADELMLHPSIQDHTGMALPDQEPSVEALDEVPLRADSPPPKPLFVCARCNAHYEDADDLLTHERTENHIGSYNYKCGVCKNIYTRLDALRDHMCRHTGEKPHRCNVCGEAFSFRNQLSRHRTSHYGPPQLTKEGASITADSNRISHVAAAQGVLDGEQIITDSSQTKKGMSSELKNMLTSCEFQIGDNAVCCPHTTTNDDMMSNNNSKCPKCHEVLSSRNALQKHQCPAFSSMMRCIRFSCPQCSMTYCKRSLLERHRCPSLIYHEGTQIPKAIETGAQFTIPEDNIIPENALIETAFTVVSDKITPAAESAAAGESSDNTNEDPPGSQDKAPTKILPANLVQSDDAQASNEMTFCTQIIIDTDSAKEMLEPIQEEGQTILPGKEISSKEISSNDSPSQDTPSNITPSQDTPSQDAPSQDAPSEDTPSQDIPSQDIPSEDIPSQDTPSQDTPSQDTSSTIRRSNRTAGKVNAILAMLKKKPSSKVEKNETLGDKESTSNSDGHETDTYVPMAVEVSQSEFGQWVITPDDNDIVTDSEKQEPMISNSISIHTQTDFVVKIEEEEIIVIKRKRGRPPLNRQNDMSDDWRKNITPKRVPGRPLLKKRGRPRKRPASPIQDTDVEAEATLIVEAEDILMKEGDEQGNPNTQAQIVKKKCGRPRKTQTQEESGPNIAETPETNISTDKQVLDASENSPIKRKRGRPKKIHLLEPVHEINNDDFALDENIVDEGEKENIGNVEGSAESGRPKRIVKKKIFDDYEHDIGNENENDVSDYENSELVDREIKEERDSDDQMSDYDILTSGPKEGQRIRKSWTKFKCTTCDRYFSSKVALDKHKNTAIHKRGLNKPLKRKFTCKVCGQGFMKLEHLRDHDVNHTSVKRFECVVCNRKFKFRSQLALHRNSVHSASTLAQAMNNNPTPRKRYRNSHQPPENEANDPKYQPEIINGKKGEEDKLFYKCKQCENVFSELRLFNRHIISHFSVKPFKCKICMREFARADTLRNHKKVHYYGYKKTESGAFLCDTCGRQFTKADNLRNHVRMHYGVRPWSCEVCGKGFLDKYTLGRHVVIHQIQKPWLCATCGRGFNRRSHLEAHEAQHSGKNLYQCVVCQRGFSDQGNLGRHMLVHSDARPWACDVCGDTFKRKGNLDEHELTHNSDRQVVCDVCGARFTTKRYLRIHQLIHSGDRPHKCGVCAATFRQLSALIIHRRLHTGDAPYKCVHCGKHFKYYDQWKAHEYAHTDSKPYKCLYCSATYRQAGSLRQHRKVMHNNQKGVVFLCTVCNKTFASTMSLERHMKKVHGAEATLQSLQAIGQEAMGTAAHGDDTQMPSTISNMVQITNPQGNIETLELANIQTDNNASNLVQLLNGQTLTTLTQQGTVTTPVGLQLTDGQRIVHMIGHVEDRGQQVMQVLDSDRQVLTIDNMQLSNQQGIVVTDQQGTVLTEHQVAVITEAQGTIMTDQQISVMANEHVTVMGEHHGTIITNEQGETIIAQHVDQSTDHQGSIITSQEDNDMTNHQVTVMTDQTGTTLTEQTLVITDVQAEDQVMTDEVTVLAEQQSYLTVSQAGVVTECNDMLSYSPSMQQTVVQITDAQAFVDAVSHMEQTGADSETLNSLTVSDPQEQLNEMQTMTIDADSTVELQTVVEMHPDLASQQVVSTAGLVSIEVVPIETTVTTLAINDGSSQAEHQVVHHQGVHQIPVVSDDETIKEQNIENVTSATTYCPAPNT